jgi:hypothetical protein
VRIYLAFGKFSLCRISPSFVTLKPIGVKPQNYINGSFFKQKVLKKFGGIGLEFGSHGM